MKTRGMKIRRQLRSVRASALSDQERLDAMREAQDRGVSWHAGPSAAAAVDPPHGASRCETRRPPDVAAEPAGDTEIV